MVTTTPTATSRLTPGIREAAAIASAATTMPGMPPTISGTPVERREDEAGEDRVGERLGRVGEPVEDDPAAERSAGDADQGHLDHRAPHELVLQGLEHAQWWWGGRIARASVPGSSTIAPP